MRFLSLYHRMPVWMRSLAATAHGVTLQRQRYGRNTERLVEEALARETWSAGEWDRWRKERLAFILHRAATRVPYYRDVWARRRALGYRGSWEVLENWPVLEKEQLRNHAAAFVADDRDVNRLHCDHTSGTTGTPLRLWQSRETVEYWYALSEARWRKWYGVSRHDRWAILGGQLVAPAGQTEPPFWVWNVPMRQLYMSSYHLSPQHIPDYLDALDHYRIRYLLGYSSSLYALAREMVRTGRDGLSSNVVITNAEPLFDYQREAISSAFRCPVRETYGMSEMVAAASQCEAGGLHLWPEAGVVELERDQDGGEGDVTGQLIATGLANPDMPLIRYYTGDRVTMPAKPEVCACGRTLPLLVRIEGRSDDVLYTADGRAIGRLDPVFKADYPIREAQIIQESFELVRLLYVPAPGCAERHVSAMADQIRARMPGVQVVAEVVEAIPRGANNKFRAVVCRLPAHQRGASRAGSHSAY
ncbi:MAG TPA: hypothetical protein VMA31_14355 [Bryobacteraceae bacterium]|nr:hypothetical protein [Bryobacteraceae bacterium]